MRSLGCLAVVLGLVVGVETARADCVDYDQARREREAKTLAAKPPPKSAYGLPESAPLRFDPDRSSSDPVCDGPVEKRRTAFFKTDASVLEVYEALFPYVVPRDVWTSPALDHSFRLNSGVEVTLRCNDSCSRDILKPGAIREIMVVRNPAALKPLVEAGPGWNWTARDFAENRGEPAMGRATSYAGGVVPRASGSASTGSSTNRATATTTASANTPPTKPNCPTDTASGAAAGALGGALGSALSRGSMPSAGALLGGLGRPKPKPEPGC